MCSYMHGMCNIGRTSVPKSVPNFTDTDSMICILVYTSHISFIPRQFHSSLLLMASVSLAMVQLTSSGTDTCTVSAYTQCSAGCVHYSNSLFNHKSQANSLFNHKVRGMLWIQSLLLIHWVWWIPNKVWLMSRFVERSPAASMGYRRMQPPHPITVPAGVSMDMHGFTCPGQ